MNNSMYIASTSLLMNQKKMDIVSNNLANMNTTGYKKDTVIAESFPEVLLSRINDKPDIENQKNFSRINVQVNENVYRLSTNNGYFRVKTPAGISYTRELKFIIDRQEGYLKTFYKDKVDSLKPDGENFILGKNGPIKVDGEALEIDTNGNVLVDGQIVDNLITFPHPSVIGTINGGVRFDKVITNFVQGNLVETGNLLDFALKGDGFFKVYTNDGIMYTRDGSFSLNENGELVTSEGYLVLGQYGSIIVDGQDFTINEQGEIISDGEIIDRLDIVRISNKEFLRKQGNNMYSMLEGVEPEEELFDGQVLRGYLEGSNVETIKEMVNMITLLRNYEANQKIINMQDELLGKAVNEIARI